MEQSFTHSFSQNISLSLFMECSTEGSSRGTLLWREDETKHQSLHSVSGSSGMSVDMFLQTSLGSSHFWLESEHYIMVGKSSKSPSDAWVYFMLAENALRQQWFSSAYSGLFGTQPLGHSVFDAPVAPVEISAIWNHRWLRLVAFSLLRKEFIHSWMSGLCAVESWLLL